MCPCVLIVHRLTFEPDPQSVLGLSFLFILHALLSYPLSHFYCYANPARSYLTITNAHAVPMHVLAGHFTVMLIPPARTYGYDHAKCQMPMQCPCMCRLVIPAGMAHTAALGGHTWQGGPHQERRRWEIDSGPSQPLLPVMFTPASECQAYA